VCTPSPPIAADEPAPLFPPSRPKQADDEQVHRVGQRRNASAVNDEASTANAAA
jgi:hypothetical protein